MRKRADVLRDLLNGVMPVDALSRELATYGWDSVQEIETLRRSHVIAMLDQYLSGSRTAQEVRNWAEAIEGRDDIGFEENSQGALIEAIFELSNPELAHSLSPLLARKIAASLTN